MPPGTPLPDATAWAAYLDTFGLDTRSIALRARLEALLKEHEGNVSEVARVIGRSRPLVHRWLKELRLEPAHYRRRIPEA